MRDNQNERFRHPAPLESYEFVTGILIQALGWFACYVLHNRYHITDRQILELLLYLITTIVCGGAFAWSVCTQRSRCENGWPHRSLVISRRRDERIVLKAWNENAVVLGYDVHGRPWLWPDRIRVMQGIALAQQSRLIL